ncbi:MAG: hypothetical protein KIS76_14730 [Pyrinomonadaceae bacterium]|nr:hypothetical protein [Pyrinomonadaceae bacterium]
MAGEKPKISILQIICVAFGVFLGLMLVRFVFALEGVFGGAIGGALGAAIGLGLFELINRFR